MKIFPSQSEFLYYSGKLGDMEVLDDIANGDASYRPRTCHMSEPIMEDNKDDHMVMVEDLGDDSVEI